MDRYMRQLRHYAEHNPKASSAALVGGTLLSCAAIVVFIDLRDRLTHNQQINNGSILQAATTEHTSTTRNEAQLAAMLENAKKSSWQDNLRNAADAQDRFMLPGRDVDSGRRDAPEYIKRIDKRSEEILQKQEEEKNKDNEKDPSKTRFWK